MAQESEIRASEIEAASAMELADRLLPPAMRAEVVSGQIKKRFVAGPNFWIGYNTEPFSSYTVPKGFCAKYLITIDIAPTRMETLSQYTSAKDSERILQIMAVERQIMIALPVEGDATLANCATAQGFVAGPEYGEDETVIGYRQLVAAIRAARSGSPLPFRLSCRTESLEDGGSSRCMNKVEALAHLPLKALFSISRNDDPDEDADEIEGYEASFGPAEDGLSWRVYWSVSNDGQIEEMRLRKISIVYH